jgi:prepilin-type N-terminal cleavage/methylation domain-containing protein
VRSPRGFSLIEVCIALAILSTAVLALSALTLTTQQTAAAAGQIGVAQLAARARLEDLRALAWTSDAAGVPISDWSADLTSTPPRPAGGRGLGQSPGDTLDANVAGYCDFLDAEGQWLGAGTTPPANTAWIRRWMVQPTAADPDLLVIQVLVVSALRSSENATADAARGLNGAWLQAIRARRSR